MSVSPEQEGEMITIPAIDMVATGRNIEGSSPSLPIFVRVSVFLDIIFEIVVVEEKLLIIAEEAAQ